MTTVPDLFYAGFVGYSLSVAKKVTGVSGTLIRKWEQRNVFVCENRLKSGKWRTYSYRDLVRLRLIQLMTDLGIAAKHAADAAKRAPTEDESMAREIAAIEATRDGSHVIYMWSPAESVNLWPRGMGANPLYSFVKRNQVTVAFDMTNIRASVLADLDAALEAEQ